jgi:hypothetical protein
MEDDYIEILTSMERRMSLMLDEVRAILGHAKTTQSSRQRPRRNTTKVTFEDHSEKKESFIAP